MSSKKRRSTMEKLQNTLGKDRRSGQACRQIRLKFETLEPRQLLAASAEISEFMALNQSTIQDSDGDYSDWIEIHNTTAAPLDLNGWSLTDDTTMADKWEFPPVTLAAGGYLTVFASGKDRHTVGSELHTNFQLSGDGEYLALFEPDGDVATKFDPYPAQRDDVSFGIAQQTTATLLTQGATSKTLIPSNDLLGLTWTNETFVDTSWVSGKTGVGYDVNIGPQPVAYWNFDDAGSATATDYTGNAHAATLVNGPAWVAGKYGSALSFDGSSQYVKSTVDVSETAYSISFWFNTTTPDGGLVALVDGALGANGNDRDVYLTNGNIAARIWNNEVITSTGLNLADGQWHHVVHTMGGSYATQKIYVDGLQRAVGSKYVSDFTWQTGIVIGFANDASPNFFTGLIDDVAIFSNSLGGGQATLLAQGSSPLSCYNLLGTNVRNSMRTINSSAYVRIPFTVGASADLTTPLLRMKYDDGFVAWLNGVEIARRNAPETLAYDSAATTDRSKSAALIYEEIEIPISSGLLHSGTNVLAIQGLTNNKNSNEFLILPQLVQIVQTPNCYMVTPTPGFSNKVGILGFVSDTSFSVDRGFYSAPFSLTIANDTPGATIRYTIDGSTPTATTGTVYSVPLMISGTQTLRAAAFLEGFQPSDVDTQTYLFTADVKLQSANGVPPAGWPSGSVNGQSLNYGMDPDIVNSPTWGPQIETALKAIPTISIVTDLANLFNPLTGIYVNASQDGRDWERPTSVELIYPDGTEGFQIDAGLRIRGGYSRYSGNPKHAFRLLFRDEYGGDLEYPLFGDGGAQEFENLDLRCSQNYSWSFEGNANNSVVRDIFSRDVQGAMGDPHSHGQPYHLYINGQYWGLYESDERPEAEFAASYLGGDDDGYDVIKVDSSGYTIYATDGTIDAWKQLWNLANAGFSSNASYYRVLGKNPDGTRNPTYPVYVDQSNLIDYMIAIFYSGNLDAPVSAFLGNGSPNNFYAIYDRQGLGGFKFILHDSEHTLSVVGDSNRTSNFPAGDTFDKSNPQWLHQQLMANPEYRVAFSDRVQKFFFNGGALTPTGAQAIYQARANQISLAIIAESARWGDSVAATPLTKTNWQNAVTADLNWMNTRSSVVLNQLKSTTLRNGTAAPLFPNVAAPIFSQRGGVNQSSYSLTLSAAAGTIYYTLDGSDPRLPGGGISPSAMIYTGSTSNTTLISQGSTWKYLDNGTNQGTAWRTSGFNDTAWSSGPAQLGYGDGDEATTVGYIDTDAGTAGVQKNATTYFRKTFNITNPAQILSLTLELLRDDGAVVYINGQEVTSARTNMPTGAIAYNTWANGLSGGADESTFYSFSVDPSFLVAGTNVIAVEIHQYTNDSSDISFDLRLGAATSATPITLNNTAIVKTRALNGGTWSALDEAQFIVDSPAAMANLTVSEINYHPADPNTAELAVNPLWTDSDFEFLELKNTSAGRIDLTGVAITQGITFNFSGGSVTKIAPGDYVLVVKNLAAFEARYGSEKLDRVAGVFSGSLSNSGELLTVVDRLGANILSFSYGDSGAWPGRADGSGSSLELANPAAVPTTAAARTAYLENATNWRSSYEFFGTPAAAGTGAITSVIVNEVLAHTDLPMLDAIELYNTTGATIDISGWCLSDDNDDYPQYRFPEGTILAAYEYRVFDEDDFGFRLDAAEGDDVWLISADAAGKLVAFVEHVEFGAVANGVSLGRWPNAAGGLYPLKTRTLGQPNDIAGNGPRVGPLLISEVMYKPSVAAGQNPDDYEYLEIFNPTEAAVPLDNWRLRGGINFDFAAGTTLAAHGTLVVLPFSPSDPLSATKLANFKTKYGVADTVQLAGPFTGQLSDTGEAVELQRPDEAVAGTLPPFYPGILEDEIRYGTSAPWPTAANGGGSSLQRLKKDAWGDASTSWIAAAPTLGTAMLVVGPDDWTSVGLTLKIAGDGKLHLYCTGTTTDAVPPQTLSSITAVYLTGRDYLDDALTIDFSGGNPLPWGGLSFDGGLLGTGSGNALSLKGTAANDTAILTAAQVALNGATAASYTNVAFFAFDLGGGTNSLTVDHATLRANQNNAISAGTKVTVDGGSLDLNGHSASLGNLTLTGDGQANVSALNNTTTTVTSGALIAVSIICDTLTIGGDSTTAAASAGAVSSAAADARPMMAGVAEAASPTTEDTSESVVSPDPAAAEEPLATEANELAPSAADIPTAPPIRVVESPIISSATKNADAPRSTAATSEFPVDSLRCRVGLPPHISQKIVLPERIAERIAERRQAPDEPQDRAVSAAPANMKAATIRHLALNTLMAGFSVDFIASHQDAETLAAKRFGKSERSFQKALDDIYAHLFASE